jgi:hypothetical protein
VPGTLRAAHARGDTDVFAAGARFYQIEVTRSAAVVGGVSAVVGGVAVGLEGGAVATLQES